VVQQAQADVPSEQQQEPKREETKEPMNIDGNKVVSFIKTESGIKMSDTQIQIEDALN